MKIYFVGIHNKPGMKPLDSKTESGKIIDQIISQLPECECIKTNLCNSYYYPVSRDEILKHGRWWKAKYQPSDDDIIVTLGRWVGDNFTKHFTHPTVIKLTHPASSIYRSQPNYVSDAVEKIKAEILKQKQ
jgi:hypothetical protein